MDKAAHNSTDLEPAHPGAPRTAPGALARWAAASRDRVARRLVSAAITPNQVSAASFIAACGAAFCLLIGATDAAPWAFKPFAPHSSWWPILAGLCLAGSGVLDILDGTVARLTGRGTRFGALLDSTLDRFSDMLILGACAIHSAATGNVTYVALSILALAHAVQISYVKARAENLVASCGVGFWQRPERVGLLIVALLAGRLPAGLWILATLPLATVVRRVLHARRMLGMREQSEMDEGPAPLRRGSAAYGALAVLLAAFMLLAPWIHPMFGGQADPLRAPVSRIAAW